MIFGAPLTSGQIVGDLFAGRDCFLDTEEWRSIPADHHAINLPPELSQLCDEFSRFLSVIPGLVWRGYAVPKFSAAQVSSLVQRALHLRERFEDWFGRLTTLMPLPDDLPSTFDDGLFPTVYKYSSVTSAVLFVSYYASMIILYEVLKACHYPVDFQAETAELRDKICMSIEYVYDAGRMGLYRLGYSIIVALEVSPPATRLWLKRWLVRFAKVYASASPEVWPKVEGEVEEVVG